MIPFNKVFLTGNELKYINKTLESGKIAGNGNFTKLCQLFFETRYGFKKALLTTSCTDALEMCAMLANINVGDEVIIPSYTFVSTALPFIRQGAKVIFADSGTNNPNMDVANLEYLISSKTKAIVVVHYAGVACDMDTVMALASKYNLLVIEDAAQAVDSFYIDSNRIKRPLGSIGHLAAFSFHETKNIVSGEGGMLVINDDRFVKRAEIIWEKGTNRAEFFRGEVNKYGWVDTGSSFLASDIIAAFLWAQLESLDKIQEKRILLWNKYYECLSKKNLDGIQLPIIPSFGYNNGHMFYIVAKDLSKRNSIISRLKDNGYHAVFHYLSLHASEYFKDQYAGQPLINSDNYTDCLLRLPLYCALEPSQIEELVEKCF